MQPTPARCLAHEYDCDDGMINTELTPELISLTALVSATGSTEASPAFADAESDEINSGRDASHTN